ncbi:MAG TPA: hypothetical protein VNA10_04120, partial [Thermoplasmata archaeon]|nr:hypothetical protein [Thermoplasmata archaeon]
WSPGSTVTVVGTITSTERQNTSYGPEVYLGLDGGPGCAGVPSVAGDPTAKYEIGARFQTTLHFQRYMINGDPAVSAPELQCPFPSGLRAIGTVLDAGSLYAGRLFLVYNGTESNGTVHYEIVTANGAAYAPDTLPATLRKSTPLQGSDPILPAGAPIDSFARWIDFSGLQYLGALGAYSEFPIVDEMSSLAAGISRNGSLRFVDANRNGLVDDGDRLDVNLAATGSPTAWDTFQLIIGGLFVAPETYVACTRFIVNGPMGPFDIPLPERRDSHVKLRYAGDTIGTTFTSKIDVRSGFGPAPALSDVRFFLQAGGSSGNGTLSALPITLSNGVSLALTDANGNGRLDSGDMFRAAGLGNRTSVTLDLARSNASVGTLSWVVGYGEPIGRVPLITFTTQGTNPWRATANSPFWSPELALNRTVRASLLENGIAVLTNVSLASGVLGTFANGTLAFTDSDGDGSLSSGDVFTVTGASGNRYELDVSVLYGYPWRAYL